MELSRLQKKAFSHIPIGIINWYDYNYNEHWKPAK